MIDRVPLNITPPPGTRFPNFGDEEVPFAPKGALRGIVDWLDFLGFHSPSERKFTLLASHEGSISAAACFFPREQDLFVELLARNDLYRPQTYVAGGAVLVGALENIAEQLDLPLLRLESVEDPATLEWYVRQGFEHEAKPYHDDQWGTMYPMVKRVVPFGRE